MNADQQQGQTSESFIFKLSGSSQRKHLDHLSGLWNHRRGRLNRVQVQESNPALLKVTLIPCQVYFQASNF